MSVLVTVKSSPADIDISAVFGSPLKSYNAFAWNVDMLNAIGWTNSVAFIYLIKWVYVADELTNKQDC